MIDNFSKYNAKAIAAEKYYKNITDLYAVAIVKKKSSYKSIKDLKNKKSCHSPDMKSAGKQIKMFVTHNLLGIAFHLWKSYSFLKFIGWIAPMYALIQNKLIDKESCDYTESFAEFFSGGSCIPFAPENSVGYSKLTNICGKKSASGFEGDFWKILLN